MGDRDNLLQPRRLETLERIMSLYGKHLEANDKIRIGVEGDPCSRFRSMDDAPSATVDKILERRDDGFVRFRAVMDVSGEAYEFTNRSFDPDTVWELHPNLVEEFSARVRGEYRGDPTSSRALEEKIDSLADKLSVITKEISERIATLEENNQEYRGGDDVGELKESEKAFRETMASTIRALAGDTLRLARGEPVEFAHQYVDRYDMALEDRASSMYRSSSSPPSKRKHDRQQEEKWSFDAYRNGESITPEVEDVSQLTD